MKRFLLTIICVVAVIFVYAEGHMTFKGIEIDGDLPSFVAKLEAQGFIKQSIGEDYATMTGSFTAEDVKLYIHATPISKTVYGVSVIYKPQDSWPHQESHYRNLAKSLKTKYGEPVEDVWEVNELVPKSSLEDGYSTAKMGFRCDNGGVGISIEKTLHYDVSTRIFYWDKENNAKNQTEVESDL